MRYFLVPCILMLLVSCENLKTKSPEVFFPVDSLINAQVEYLSNSKADIIKSGTIKGDSAGETLESADSLQWSRELAIFRRADINKPRLKEKYNVQRKQLPDGTREVSYTAQEKKNLPVRFLAIRYEGNPASLKVLEATISDDNPLYKSERRIQMEFEKADGESRLISYFIEGGQKMKLRDSVLFDINARVRYH